MSTATQTFSGGWRRVSRAHPCPICERPDWCLIAVDRSAAICARVESPKRCGEAGWLHRLTDSPGQPRRRQVREVRFAAGGPRADLARLATQYRQDLDSGRLHQFAVSLGLSVTSLCQLGVGWSKGHQAWSFPMTDVDGDVRGIRLRRPNGSKFAVKGGKEGLFIPSTVKAESSPLLVCEGPTDTAALLDLGFADVVGRPSCTGGIRLLVDFVQRHRHPPEVVIVSDGDEPGRRGADNLSSVLAVYTPAVRVIRPPEKVEDARAWLQAGGRRQDVEEAIRAAAPRRLCVTSRRAAHER